MLFQDRYDAGRQLAERLRVYEGKKDAVVLGLPRGGVPVAFEVARLLKLPLDIFVVRKLGMPGQQELAIGAIASGNVRVLNDELVNSAGIDEAALDQITQQEQVELNRRERLYRGDRAPYAVTGNIVIVVDDGLATGASMKAALRALRQRNPARMVVAVPTGAEATCDELTQYADEVVCLSTPEPFRAVGLWYKDFAQTADEEVCQLLAKSIAEPA